VPWLFLVSDGHLTFLNWPDQPTHTSYTMAKHITTLSWRSPKNFCTSDTFRKTYSLNTIILLISSFHHALLQSHTHHWFKIMLPNTDQAHDKHQWTTTNFSQVQLYTNWWWITYDPKHVGVIFNFMSFKIFKTFIQRRF